MKTFICAGGFFVALGLAAVYPALAADQAPSNNPAAVDGSDHEARLVSAFFGLDNDLPFGANRLCFGASGCTSSDLMGPISPFSKRHFSADCFSSLAC